MTTSDRLFRFYVVWWGLFGSALFLTRRAYSWLIGAIDPSLFGAHGVVTGERLDIGLEGAFYAGWAILCWYLWQKMRHPDVWEAARRRRKWFYALVTPTGIAGLIVVLVGIVGMAALGGAITAETGGADVPLSRTAIRNAVDRGVTDALDRRRH